MCPQREHESLILLSVQQTSGLTDALSKLGILVLTITGQLVFPPRRPE